MSRATDLYVGGEAKMYQALYRKWRPKIFDEVIGQEHITETLKTQVQTGHLSHAYIFIGTRGTGKTTCARILAKAVNCENPVNGNPCNCCRSCRGIDDGSILDIVELDAASNTGVDNVRELREEAVFSPAAAKKRVYIIDEVHMLSLAAFNALLKIIEEPPSHLMFILATTELQKVPATILSRCQRHSFHRIPTTRMAEYLKEIASRENLKLDAAAASLIGRLAEGGVRDALSILDQCSSQKEITPETVYETMGLAGNQNLVQILRAVLSHDSTTALLLFKKIWMDGKEPAAFLTELNGLIRDIMIVKAAAAGAGELISGNYEREILDELSAAITKEELLYCADTIQKSIIQVRQVRNPRTVAEICIVSLCDSRTAESIQSLRARISRLEEANLNRPVPKCTGLSEQSSQDTEIGKPEQIMPENMKWAPDSDSNDDNSDSDVEKSFTAQENAGSDFSNVQSELSPPADTGFISLSNQQTREYQSADCHSSDYTGQDETKDISLDNQKATEEILAAVREKLPIEIRFSITDHEKFQMKMQDRELVLEALPGFLLDRLKRTEIRAIFCETAEKVLGYPVAVQLKELSIEHRKVRDLEELRKFKEVTFIES